MSLGFHREQRNSGSTRRRRRIRRKAETAVPAAPTDQFANFRPPMNQAQQRPTQTAYQVPPVQTFQNQQFSNPSSDIQSKVAMWRQKRQLASQNSVQKPQQFQQYNREPQHEPQREPLQQEPLYVPQDQVPQQIRQQTAQNFTAQSQRQTQVSPPTRQRTPENPNSVLKPRRRRRQETPQEPNVEPISPKPTHSTDTAEPLIAMIRKLEDQLQQSLMEQKRLETKMEELKVSHCAVQEDATNRAQEADDFLTSDDYNNIQQAMDELTGMLRGEFKNYVLQSEKKIASAVTHIKDQTYSAYAKVIPESGVDLFSEPRLNASVLEHIDHGEKIYVTFPMREMKDPNSEISTGIWIKCRRVTPDGQFSVAWVPIWAVKDSVFENKRPEDFTAEDRTVFLGDFNI